MPKIPADPKFARFTGIPAPISLQLQAQLYKIRSLDLTAQPSRGGPVRQMKQIDS